MCDTGEVYISAAIHDQIEGKVTAAFDDLGEHTVKNIDKPIRVYRVSNQTGAPVRATTVEDSDEPLPLPDKPSIAVLPFDNMSGDPDQEYFSDGIAEDIITDLSKIAGLFVIARHSSFTYKGKSVLVKQVAQELGVRHVLEGSVRKAGKRVRINAQLIDATTGGHLWAERYDGDLEDIFSLQDEITAKIVSGLKVSLTGSERECELEAVIRISHVAGLPGGSRVHVPIKDPEFRVGILSIDSLESDREGWKDTPQLKG